MNYIMAETFSRSRNKTLGGFIGTAYAILYNDNEQIVITRDAYESRKESLEYNFINNVA